MLNNWFRLASGFMLAGVLLGAFGAHALKDRLTPELLQIYQTGVLYHFLHALGLFAVSWAATQAPANKRIHLAGWVFCLGILVFSGSLYALALTGVKTWGAVTPIGGALFLIGWALLTFGVAGPAPRPPAA